MLNSTHGELARKLLAAVTDVQQQLAQAMVKDGEGATKFVAIHVEQGTSSHECLQIAYAIAHSPLIKTALTPATPTGAHSGRHWLCRREKSRCAPG